MKRFICSSPNSLVPLSSKLLLELLDRIDHVLQTVLVRGAQWNAGNPADRIHFQRLAQLIEFDDVFALQVGNHHTAIRIRLEQALGRKLAHCFANGGTAAAKFLGQYQFGDG